MTSLRELAASTRRYVCASHPELRLSVSASGGQPGLRCSGCSGPAVELVTVEGVGRRYRQGAPLPAAMLSHLHESEEPMPDDTLPILMKREITEVELADVGRKWAKKLDGFGQLKPADEILVAQLAHTGFQPFHLNIIHGRPYMNMDGWAYWSARAMGRSYGGVTHRFMSDEERKAYKLEESEIGVIATMHKYVGDGRTIPIATEIGRAGGARDSKRNARGNLESPVAYANPAEMAVKRARVRVMRAGCPLGVNMDTYDPSIGVIDDEPEELQRPANVNEHGEIIDVEPGELVEETDLLSGLSDAPEPEPETPDPGETGRPLTSREMEILMPSLKAGLQEALTDRRFTLANINNFKYAGLAGVEALRELLAKGVSIEEIIQRIDESAVPY